MARRGENIYHRKDGRWEGRYKSGYDESGKAKYRSVYGHSYMEVREKLAPLKTRSPAPHVTCRMTVKELFNEWLSAVKLRVKTSTFANYLMKVEKHILPVFGGMKYDMLTVQMLNSFIQEKLDSGLSAKYVSDIVIVFKSMSKYSAKIHGFHNILADVELPKVHRSEAVLLTRNQQLHLWRYFQRNPCTTSLCVLLSLYTGLRVGEVCGLMWKDIDFEKSVLAVRWTVQRIRNSDRSTCILADTPKSRTSRRSIPIPKFLMKLLRESRSNDNYYILSGSNHIIEPRTLQRRFKSILKKADLPSVSYHSLRHAFATNCLQAGFDVKTLSEILGHSSVETTLNRYEHHTTTCDRCGNTIWTDDSYGDEYTTLCRHCYENHYTRCSCCDALLHEDDAYHLDGYDYCSECYHDEVDKSRSIHDYGYKPEPIFYGDGKRYFGVELEIDGAGKDSDNADEILSIANKENEHIYIKGDGSLDDGMELVSHPASLEYHKNYQWEEIMKKAISLRYRSHQTSTCGLHIHVNRDSLGETREEQDEVISRILYFVEHHWNELLKFSRRSEYSMNRWAARYGYEHSPKAILDKAKKGNNGRYAAVNLMNYATIEFRMFRGTLKYNTFIAALQLVNMICDVAVYSSDDGIAKISWSDFVAGITEPELIQYLKERQLYVNDAVNTSDDI